MWLPRTSLTPDAMVSMLVRLLCALMLDVRPSVSVIKSRRRDGEGEFT